MLLAERPLSCGVGVTKLRIAGQSKGRHGLARQGRSEAAHCMTHACCLMTYDAVVTGRGTYQRQTFMHPESLCAFEWCLQGSGVQVASL